MANPEHLAKLKEGVEAWNLWRQENPEVVPDLTEAKNLSYARLSRVDLHGADLTAADLSRTDLPWANLSSSNFSRAFLSGAFLKGADLSNSNLSGADLRNACLHRTTLREALLIRANLNSANLSGADLLNANLRAADLSGANLDRTTLVGTNLEGADLTACHVYGISAWDVNLEGAIQKNLVITPRNESRIQVDNLEVAQFIYLLLDNQKIRSVIDTITYKLVLILGRFTPKRKVVLDAIRDELRKRDYLPVLFDFEKPASKDLTGTISTLANMARFVIADLTGPSSVPHELATIVPNTVVPVQAIILKGQREYAMFADLMRRHHWVLKPHQYKSRELLIAQLGETVIAPAEAKAKELARK